MTSLARTGRPRGPARWKLAAAGLPLALALVLAALWVAMRVGALNAVPWPRSLAFEGDADAFIACFEARAEIATRRDATFVTLFSERPEGATEILVKMGGDLGRDGLRSVALLRQPEGGFVLRDRHYLPDHSPLSQPMRKRDWITALRCARAGG